MFTIPSGFVGVFPDAALDELKPGQGSGNHSSGAVVTLHIVILEQGGDDDTLGVTGVNEFRVAKVYPHVIDLLFLERDEEEEVPGS